jgi:hypothetical protein
VSSAARALCKGAKTPNEKHPLCSAARDRSHESLLPLSVNSKTKMFCRLRSTNPISRICSCVAPVRLVLSVLTHKIRFGRRSDDSKCQMFSVGATPTHPLVSFGSSHDNIILFVMCIFYPGNVYFISPSKSVWLKMM